MSKMTRQGVRDLSHLKGKSVGKKVELPPFLDPDNCTHEALPNKPGNYKCEDCSSLVRKS